MTNENNTLEKKTEMDKFYNNYIEQSYQGKKKEEMKEKLLELPFEEKKKFVEEMMMLREGINRTYKTVCGTRWDITHRSLEGRNPYERKENIRDKKEK